MPQDPVWSLIVIATNEAVTTNKVYEIHRMLAPHNLDNSHN